MRSQYRMLFAFVALLLAVSLACNGGSTPAAPTAIAIPTKVSLPPTSVPQQIDTPVPSTNGGSSELYTFTDKNNLLAFDLPGDWLYESGTENEYYTDTFTSPDESAKIESLVYNDGEPFVRSQNGQFALYLLNTYYSNTGKTGDIRISSDQIMNDGSERLEWTSKGGGYSGVSFFELRGDDDKTFLMFTAWWTNGADQAILDTIDNAIASYTIP